MKIYLKNIPITEEDEEQNNITPYVKKINKRKEKLSAGKGELNLSDFTIEVINDGAKFSEITASFFFPEGNAYNTIVYLVDEETGVIIDSGVIKQILEYANKGTCHIVCSSPLKDLNKNVQIDLSAASIPDVILNVFEKLEITNVFINTQSFEKAKNYYDSIGFSISVNLTLNDKKNGFNLINEILQMTGDAVYIQNNVVYYYLASKYEGEGGINIPESEYIDSIVLKRTDGNNIINRVKYKLSDTVTYQLDITQTGEWEYLKNIYKLREHFKDYSGTNFKVNASPAAFMTIAENVLYKRGDRKLIVELTLPVKYSFLKIGSIVNLTFKNREIYSEPFEIVGREFDLEKKVLKIKAKDLNLYPKILPQLFFIPPKAVEHFTVWIKGTHVYFNWEPVNEDVQSNEIEISSYCLYYGAFSNNYDSVLLEKLGSSPVKLTGTTGSIDYWDLPIDKNLYFNITAVSNNNIESNFTTEICVITGNSGFGITNFGTNYGH